MYIHTYLSFRKRTIKRKSKYYFFNLVTLNLPKAALSHRFFSEYWLLNFYRIVHRLFAALPQVLGQLHEPQGARVIRGRDVEAVRFARNALVRTDRCNKNTKKLSKWCGFLMHKKSYTRVRKFVPRKRSRLETPLRAELRQFFWQLACSIWLIWLLRLHRLGI
jgi:hypothetical protein